MEGGHSEKAIKKKVLLGREAVTSEIVGDRCKQVLTSYRDSRPSSQVGVF